MRWSVFAVGARLRAAPQHLISSKQPQRGRLARVIAQILLPVALRSSPRNIRYPRSSPNADDSSTEEMFDLLLRTVF